MAKIVAIWGVVAIASAIIGGLVASAKGRDHSFWAAWSFLVPPMLLILLVMPSNKGPRQRRPGIDEIEDHQAF
jgi:H+/Cl- antiporter ClcA